MMHKDDAKADTEERILEAALSIFASKGKDGARMQEIADEAGINKAMLHYYFRSKEKLYEAVFKDVFRQFTLHHSSAVQDGTTFAQTLRLFIDAFIRAIQEKPDIVRLMVNENLSGGNTIGRIITGADHENTPPSILKMKLEEAIQRGEIRQVHPDHTLLTVLSCCLFFFIWEPTIKMKVPESNNWNQFVESRKQHIFDLIYHGLPPFEPGQ